MAPAHEEGFQSDALRTALDEALARRPARLEDLLARHGGALQVVPNLKLAAAFGAEMIGAHAGAAALLQSLAADDAAPDTARVFLPIAAAYGWVGRLRGGRDVEAAWAALADLAADERAPVRLGVLGALATLAAREGMVDTLIERAMAWQDAEDRELRFGAAALVIETLAAPGLLARARDLAPLRDYLSRVIADVADSPRSAERSEARRRVLASLPRTLIVVIARSKDGDASARWFEAECEQARHPHVRQALSQALGRLGGAAHGLRNSVVETLRKTLTASAKPARDPTRIRPGVGRGKASRPIR